MDAVRKLIREIVDARDIKLAQLSRKIGKNHAYLQQYLNREIPITLPEEVRSRLAEELDIDETALGGKVLSIDKKQGEATERAYLQIPIRDVRASAGPGSLVEGESVVGQWPFPRQYVRHFLSLSGSRLSIIEVKGDSMIPTLHSGDRVIVDHDDADVANPGVFAIYDGDATVVKRVEKVPGSEPAQIMLISDNPNHGRYSVLAEQVNVAGRIVWFGRRL